MPNQLTKEDLQALKDDAKNQLALLLPDATQRLQEALERATKPDEIQKLASMIFDYAGLAPVREQPKTESYIAMEALRNAMSALNTIAGNTANQQIEPTAERNATPPITSLAEAKQFYDKDNNKDLSKANKAGKDLGPADELTADLTYLEELE